MPDTPSKLEWAVQHLPYPDETLSGDAFVMIPCTDGLFTCVIDGLGHGEKAHYAAQVAVTALQTLPSGSLSYIMQYCHDTLTGTRGAVISMAQIDLNQNKLHWVGVGNVTGVILRHEPDVFGKLQREHLLTRGGTAGFRMPKLREYVQDFMPDDTLIMATDGIKRQFLEDLPRHHTAQETVDSIITNHRRDTDDSLVLAVRYLPDTP